MEYTYRIEGNTICMKAKGVDSEEECYEYDSAITASSFEFHDNQRADSKYHLLTVLRSTISSHAA